MGCSVGTCASGHSLQQQLQELTNQIRLAEQQKQYNRASSLRDKQIHLQKVIMSQSQAKVNALQQKKQHLKLAKGESPRGRSQRDATQPSSGWVQHTQATHNFCDGRSQSIYNRPTPRR